MNFELNIESTHIPVLSNEVLEYLDLKSGDTVFDGTLGMGGHSLQICKKIMPKGRLIAVDRDINAINIAKKRLEPYLDKISLYNMPFSEIQQIFDDCQTSEINKGLLDIGISSLQIDTPERGFSFRFNEALDMRMDNSQELTAERLIATLPEKELADTIYNYGEERFSRRIAKRIVAHRRKMSIKTTGELASIVRESVPGRSKIDKATKTFQALRIAVNDELGELERFLDEIFDFLAINGRLAIISFHSLEDRIVKNAFRDAAKYGEFKLLTKRPVVAEEEESKKNPRSRSAKLRVIERIG